MSHGEATQLLHNLVKLPLLQVDGLVHNKTCMRVYVCVCVCVRLRCVLCYVIVRACVFSL